jgi:subtilisin family serine protease
LPVDTAGLDGFTVVFVHGIGNKPAPAILKRQYDHALFGIDMGAKTRLAYWADIRYPQPLPTGEVEGLAVPRPEAYHPSAALDADTRVLDEIQSALPYGPEAGQYGAAVAARLLATSRADRARSRRMGTKILPEFLRRPVVEWITSTFIQDTAAYFFDARQRAEMQQRLRQILHAGTGPYVVIAHSQGSIIAYDVLRELDDASAPFEVPLFVTLGSPLGIDEVQDHLQKPLRVPQVVKEWWNFADLIDPVALDKTLTEEFAPQGVLKDQLVVNQDTLRISGFNPHSGSGYLSTAPVRETVRARMPSGFISPLAPFVIARDVAAEMADPTLRQPVLIELQAAQAGDSLTTIGVTLERELRTMERAFKARLSPNERRADYFRIDRLRRYISADLTAAEIDALAARHRELQIVSVWKNSVKRALLDRSTEVVQARTAQLGYGATGTGIHWAVLDTGIAAAHPHFQTHQTIVAQWDCTRVGPPAQAAPDKDGHGTHVAGIIAGRGQEPNKRYVGMAPEAKLHIYKVLDDDGSGRDAWIIKAIDHIATINEAAPELVIHGVNLSLGGPFDEAVFGCGFSPICRELHRLWRQGVVVCIAAGNEGRLVIDTSVGEQKLNLDLSIGDPANLEEAIAVGSVHRDSPHLYGISYFSSRGPTTDGRAKPDVVAPGERIISCHARFQEGQPASEYLPLSGTSMACPHVSGIIAAFLSVRREFIGHPDRVKAILMAHCTDLGRDRYHQGAGIPNLVRMLMET